MTQDVLAPERAREATYKLLSVCYQLPTSEWQVVQLIDGIVQALEVLGSESIDDAKAMKVIVDNTKDFIPLQIAFSKLFVGPMDLLAAPYASVYLGKERQVKTATTMEVLEFYHKVGLDINNEVREIPDHIRVELEVMYYLCLKGRVAEREGDIEEASKYVQFQSDMLFKHIVTWIDRFTDDIEKESPHELYKHLAKVTRTFIQEEQARMS